MSITVWKNPSLWIKYFLTTSPHCIRMGTFTSSTTILKTGVAQDCVLSLLLLTMYTYDWTATNNFNKVMKIAET